LLNKCLSLLLDNRFFYIFIHEEHFDKSKPKG